MHPGLKRLVDREKLRRRGLLVSRSAWVQVPDPQAVTFGRNCRVARGSLLVAADNERGRGRIMLGNDVLVGEYANIRATGCDISIGDDVLLGQFVSLIGANHALDADGLPTDGDDLDGAAGITIEDRCWVGVGAVVLPGAVLARGTVVGAGAVVTKNWPAGSRLIGVPARAL